MSPPTPSNSFLSVLAIALGAACALLLAAHPGGPVEDESTASVPAPDRASPVVTLEDEVDVAEDVSLRDLSFWDVSFTDLSSHSCGPSPKRARAPQPAGLDLRGSLNASNPLDLVIRVTRLARLGGETLGSSLTQQVGPEGEFCFRELPKGVYRLEVLCSGVLLGVHAYTGYSCPCDFDGSARASEIFHDDQSLMEWKVQLSVLVRVEARDKETGELVPEVSLGHVVGKEPGRVSRWRNLVVSNPPPHIEAPGFARTDVPLEHYARPTELVRVFMKREAPFRIRCQDEAGRPLPGKHWFYVHQGDESCPRTHSAQADCNGMGAHSWSIQSRGKSEVVIHGLPPTAGSRSVTLICRGSDPLLSTTLPGDQRRLTVTFSESGFPTYSRE